MTILKQTPNPNKNLIRYCGDKITFSLKLSESKKCNAFLRTNIGNATIRRKEIIDSVENNKPRLDADWHDIEMKKINDCEFALTLSLTEVGVFSSKSFFQETGNEKIVWTNGDNIKIKVEPATTVAENSIYTAFIRQFKNPSLKGNLEESKCPGTFRNFIKKVDFITKTLGFKNIQLLPIHPVPTSFAKMGTYGSPFAVLDLKNVNPAYAEFDKSATPMQQFEELIDAIHLKSAKLFLDIPINHTGWASWLQIHFPEWFKKNYDGTFRSPGAWGVVWEDLSELDYEHKKLWEYMAEVFLFWCNRGVDGFRCDAGYMIPEPVWEYVTAKVREQFPNTIFMLEGLGGKISVTESLIGKADLNWAYSELFQNYDRSQIENYLPNCFERSEEKGLQIHFAETHDNSRLAGISKSYAKLRIAIAALFSQNGGWGITAGVEWMATEKIDVHELNSLNWGAEDNQIDFIKKLNEILTTEPAFFSGTKLQMIQHGSFNGIVLLRHTQNPEEKVMIVANLNVEAATFVSWKSETFSDTEFLDLISEKKINAKNVDGLLGVHTKPGEVFCLKCISSKNETNKTNAVLKQKLKDKINKIIGVQSTKIVDCNQQKLSVDFLQNPSGVSAKIKNLPESLCVTNWQYPQDLKREIVLPASHFLLLKSEIPFSIKIFDKEKVLISEDSILGKTNFVLITPETLSETKTLFLKLTFYKKQMVEHYQTKILLIFPDKKLELKSKYSKKDVLDKNVYALLTNGRGAMAQVRGEWGLLKTKYDSFLAANLNENCPVDRHIFFTRCRAWIVCSDYSHEINIDNLNSFEKVSNNCAKWSFCLPIGQGKTVDLEISLELLEDKNVSIVKFCRLQSTKNVGCKNKDTLPIKIIVRPDIEDRSFHETTKAFTGPEEKWAAIINSEEKKFGFFPEENRNFSIETSKGKFVYEPEWIYMVHLSEEAERGLEDKTDLFSPGYFSFGLGDGETAELLAFANNFTKNYQIIKPSNYKIIDSIKQFIVKRDDSLTVIAGYPWFLDWGRDTLIALRGIISAGFISEAEEILKQFAKFEQKGTLPNMIRGNDQSNRDTSDAPLWFFVAVADFVKATGNTNIIKENCGERTFKEVLESIIENYSKGTPNGIKMDEETGLIFSPSHFTWMDTNFPAGTPREGFPIEIQALWFFALDFYFQISGEVNYKILAKKVSNSISKEFSTTSNNCLSDCLHAKPGTPAKFAEADDAIRSNQLFAITLGAVKDKELCEKIIRESEQLLIPGAIRSLADRPVTKPLPVFSDGDLLNDPNNPYFGKYQGDEDTRRKPAYHNGTAWTWPFPSYAEALLMTYGDSAINTAKSILLSSQKIFENDCILQVPEIADGDYPHQSKGCGAQAWGVTELYRLFKITNLI